MRYRYPHHPETSRADFSADNGLIATCAGSVSPWNTHLGGEEWGVPNSMKWDSAVEGAYTVTSNLSRDVLSLRHLGLHDDDLARLKPSGLRTCTAG